ncbi:MAG: ABC transporter permease [Cytophagales bacterium]|nr:ABC transporter permease [Cytophagales bacterium]
MILLKLVGESFLFALGALRAHILRTVLSLLGVTIGIFLIIFVFTIVDSLERGISGSLSFLNGNNMDIRRFPYDFSADQPWWEYFKRPYTTWEEYEYLNANMKNADGITIFAVAGGGISKYKSNTSYDNTLFGISHGYADVYDLEIEKGRYFTLRETEAGRNVAIMGHRIAEELFGRVDPIGKFFKLKGKKFYVIGLMPEEGEGFLGGSSNDDNLFIPFRSIKNMYHSGSRHGLETLISLKGLETDKGLNEMESELRGHMRRIRGLKPKQKDNFALNRQEALMNSIGGIFDVLGAAGWFIGIFSILVGGFGTANIMFVSVRERTSIIGIQKSLGAKNYFILLQFLFESIFLCLIGGGLGILIVYLLSFVSLGSLDLVLTFSNVLLGVGLSSFIGVVAGIIPAIKASRMDPVIAIRS